MDKEAGFLEQAAAVAPAELRGAIMWNTVGQISARVLNLLFILLLARLIAPRAFGLVAVGTAFITFVSIMTNIGVGEALVQRQDSVRQNASAAFYMNVLMIAVFGGALFLSSGLIARFYEEPTLIRLLPLMVASFLVRGSMAVHEAYLRKRIRFRRLQLINLASVFAYGIVASVLALRGLEAWSLVWGLLAGSCVYAGLVLVWSGMPLSLSPHLPYWRDLFKFGRWVFLAGFVGWILFAGDNLAVGKVLGSADLGVYAIAYGYGILPFMLIGGAIAQSVFPAYARLQDEPEQLDILLMKIVRLTAAVSLPLAGVFLLVGGDMLVRLLGPTWAEAGPPFRVLAVAFTVGMFSASFPKVYDALNRPIVNLYVSVAALPVLVAGIAIGLQWGVLGVAIGISAMIVELLCLQVFAISRTTDLSVRVILGGVWPSVACIGAGVAVGMLPLLFLNIAFPTLVVDAVASLVMLTVYVFAMRRFFPSLWSDTLSQGRAMLAGSRAGE